MFCMTAAVAQEVARYYVTAPWVAKHYGVSRQDVYRAAQAGRLQALEVRGLRKLWIFDVRDLPQDFPR